MMKLLALLLLTACSFAQPQLDSLFVYPEMSGVFTDGVALPDGGYIIGGLIVEAGIPLRAVLRLSADREVLWQRGVRSDLYFPMSLLVESDRVLVVTTETVPVDSSAWQVRSIVLKYSLDGDSLWAREYEDEVNFTGLKYAANDGGNGYFLLGTETVLNGETYNQDVRLLHIDSAGSVLTVDYFGGEGHDEALGMVKLDGDTLVIAFVSDLGADNNITMIWLSTSGDSLDGRVHSHTEDFSIHGLSQLARRDGGWDMYWHDPLASQIDGDALRWLRFDDDGDLVFSQVVIGPVNFIQAAMPAPDGLLTAGFSPFGNLETRNATVSRVNYNGLWYYQHEIELPLIQEAYGFLPVESGSVALLGRTIDELWISHPCLFYLSDDISISYLLSMPPYVDFGAVPVNEVVLREVALFASGDSSITIEDFSSPDFVTVDLHPPYMLSAGETLRFDVGFRPEELTTYQDTLRIFSDAGNSTLAIPVFGAASYPVCEPALSTVNFFWTVIGDTMRQPLALNNRGTLPLNIEPLSVQAPFHLDSAGPFVVEPDSSALLWFEFRPVVTGDYRDTMLVHSDDPHSPDTVLLLGRGMPSHVDAGERTELPREFRFHAAYPNPFNATATLTFDLPRAQMVTLNLFDITGRLTRRLLAEQRVAGQHVVQLQGENLTSGLYFAVLRTSEFYAVQKLVLLK